MISVRPRRRKDCANSCTMVFSSVFKFFVVYHPMLTMLGHTEADIYDDEGRVKKWAQQVSREMESVFQKSIGLIKYQRLIDRASYQMMSSKGSVLLSSISSDADKKLGDALRTLISNKASLETLGKDRQAFKIVDCCMSRNISIYDERFRTYVDRNSSCVDPSRDTSHLSSTLVEKYKSNVLSSKAIKWQYFGSTNGSYHQYPASGRRCIKEGAIFDPRLR